MKKLILSLVLCFSFAAIAADTHDALARKMSQIIKMDVFNGKWVDTWGRISAVVNHISFPAECVMKVKYSKGNVDFIYKSEAVIDFRINAPVKVKKSGLSSGVKLVFKDKIISTTSQNLRTQQTRAIQEKVAIFYHRPKGHNGYNQNLIDAILAYRKICK